MNCIIVFNLNVYDLSKIKKPRLWTDPQKLDAKSNFWGFSFMAKYSVKFKLQIVREYIKGTGGYNALAQKYEVSRK
jgi:transposase-like protein